MKPENMQNEAHVKAAVRKLLDARGAWHYMHVPVGYGRAGIPDFTGHLPVLFSAHAIPFGIETKFGSNAPTANQERELDAIVAARGVGIVVNERGLGQLEELLDTLRHRQIGPARYTFR